MGRVKELDLNINKKVLELNNMLFIWTHGKLYVQDINTEKIIYDINEKDAIECINTLLYLCTKKQDDDNYD